ncbi:MAG: nuclear transport factor 2 family protein [Gaiellaceae bacterium]
MTDKSTVNHDDQKNVNATIDEEVEAIADSDVERYFGLLAEDALFLPPGLPSMRGDDLRAWLREFLEEWAIEWLAFRHNETEVAGDLAFHRYSYSWRVTRKTGGELTVAHGKGLHILRRDEDGSWKIARKVWNARPTPHTL